jgi:hypothetical protein
VKNYLRRLCIDGQIFLWYRGHIHIEQHCVERLRVFPAANKSRYLQIEFWEGDQAAVAGSYQGGVILWPEHEETYNLNRPAVIAALIRYALQNGWINQTLLWKNGIELLALSKAPSDLSKPHPNYPYITAWVPRDAKEVSPNET